MYSIAIIEDSQDTFKKLCKRLESIAKRQNGQISIESRIGHINQNDKSPANEYFMAYIDLLIAHQANIYIVDWKLNFPNVRTDAGKLLHNLSSRDFDFNDKFWIFYSDINSGDIPEVVKYAFRNPKANAVHAFKSDLLEIERGDNDKKELVDHLEIVLLRAIEYLTNIKTSSWAEKLTMDNQHLSQLTFKRSAYDLEKFDPLNFKNRISTITVNAKCTICLAKAIRNVALFIFIDAGKIKIYLLYGRNDFAEFKSPNPLGLTRSNSFSYNPDFFDTSTNKPQLLARFKDDIYIKTKALQEVYEMRNEDSRTDKNAINIEIKKHLRLLKTHGLL